MKSIKQKCRHFKSDFLQKYDNFDKAAKRGTRLSDVRSLFKIYIEIRNENAYRKPVYIVKKNDKKSR